MTPSARLRLLVLGGAVVALVAGATAPATGTGPTTKQVSVSSTGALANDASYDQSISANGRYIAFSSTATNLVTAPVGIYGEVFLRDLWTGRTRLISPQEFEANGQPSLSADGRYAAYTSGDPVLTHSLPPSAVVVEDLSTGALRTASVGSKGVPINATNDSPSISGNGRYVAFRSIYNGPNTGSTHVPQLYVRDLTAGTTRRVSASSGGTPANDGSGPPTISADGRYIAFASDASNLVSGDTNNRTDVFVRDTVAGTTRRVSLSGQGAQGNGYSDSPSISGDGHHIAFSSTATNLVAGDSNGKRDVFVRDVLAGTTRRVSTSSTHAQGNGDSTGPASSSDGRYTAFTSSASNLVAGDTNGFSDILLNDRLTGTTRRISVSRTGVQGNQDSFGPSVSADALRVAFLSGASNLATGDGNFGGTDVFVRSPAH